MSATKRLAASDLLAFKANFTGATLEHGLLPIISFNGGYGGMVLGEGAVLTARLLHSCGSPGRTAAPVAGRPRGPRR